jgi:hypothetical protein
MKTFNWKNNDSRFELQTPSPEFSKAMGTLAHPYFSSLNPLFLFQVRELSELKKYETVLARDGIIPLLWFFYRFPKPSNLKTNILVSKDLERFIPLDWRKHVKTYEMVSLNHFGPKKKSSRLLIYGLGIESNLSIEFILRLKDRLKIKDAEISCYLPVKNDPFTPTSKEIYPLQLILQINNLSKTAIKPISWDDIAQENSFSDVAILELNEKKFISNCYVSEVLLAKGGVPICSIKPKGVTIPLSSNHGTVINQLSNTIKSQKFFDDTEMNYFKDFEKRILRPETEQTDLWPKWFQAYVLSKLS